MSYRQATQLAQQAPAHAAVSAAFHKSGAPPPASANVPENEVMQRLQAKVAQALLDQRNQMHAEKRSRQHELELERVRGQNQLQMALALSAQAWIQPSVPLYRPWAGWLLCPSHSLKLQVACAGPPGPPSCIITEVAGDCGPDAPGKPAAGAQQPPQRRQQPVLRRFKRRLSCRLRGSSTVP